MCAGVLLGPLVAALVASRSRRGGEVCALAAGLLRSGVCALFLGGGAELA